MHFSNLLTENYWIFRPAPAAHLTLALWLVLLFGMTIVGIVFIFVKARAGANALLLERYSTFLLTLGIIGLVLFYFRQEGVAFLGSRFWFAFWFIGLVVWLVSILRYQFKRIPTIRKEQAERAAKEKYLPGKK